jgi:hypothetical protein
MPFTPIPNLAPDPDVRIFFIGLQIIQVLPNNTCEVFIHRRSPDHHLSIEVRRKEAGKPDVIMMRHAGPLDFMAQDPAVPPKFGLTINVTPNPTGIKGYDGTQASTEGKKLDFALNMSTLHSVPCGAVEPAGGRPSILINEATFYSAATYTRGALLQKKQLHSPPLPPIPLNEFASIIGANIYLTAGRVATLSWRQDGRDVLLNLKKPAPQSPPGPLPTYEIYIINEPLYEDESPTAPFVHDEFDEYYHILPALPHNEQFTMTFPNPDPDRGSTRTPCASVLLP